MDVETDTVSGIDGEPDNLSLPGMHAVYIHIFDDRLQLKLVAILDAEVAALIDSVGFCVQQFSR